MVSKVQRTLFLAVCLIATSQSCLDARAQGLDILNLGGGSKPTSAAPAVMAKLRQSKVAPGGKVVVEVTIDVPSRGWTYSTDPSYDGRTRIRLKDHTAVVADYYEPTKSARQAERQKADQAKVVDPARIKADHPPKIVKDEFFGELQKYPGTVTWSVSLNIAPDAAAGSTVLKGILDYQICDDANCKPIKTPFEVALVVDGPAQSVQPVALPAGSLTFETTPEVKKKPGPVTVKAVITPEQFEVGDVVELAVSLTLNDGWYTYSNTQKPGNAAKPTELEVSDLAGVKLLEEGFVSTNDPKVKEVEAAGATYVQEVHHEEVTWKRQLLVTKNEIGLKGMISYQACTETFCLIPKRISYELGAVVASTNSVEEPSELPAPGSEPVSVDPPSADPEATAAVSTSNDITEGGLVPFLLLAIASGFGALLTPCVFPMMPITVSFFLKQAEDKNHRPVFTAIVYCGGIVATFTILGLLVSVIFGATALNTLVNNGWLNLAIAGVLLFFGANLLGMFELRVPNWLLTWSSSKEGQGGIMGTLFMAFTFTLVSFTCTFAFTGLLLVMAANGDVFWPVLGMLAFSSAFALPFFFLALFPSYLARLPKSGGWMNTAKVTMGLIEVAAAFKFLSVADLAWNPAPFFFDFEFVMVAWIVISAVTGAYLLGLFRTSHDTPNDGVSAIRLGFALCFLCLAGYMTVGLFAKKEPTGGLWQNIAAFAPPKIEGENDVDLGPVLDHEGIKYALDRKQAIKFAIQENKPMLFDFTGVNCINCRKMEKIMAHSPIKDRLGEFVLVALYTDYVPSIPERDRAEELADDNRKLQEEWFGDVTLPSYVIVTPDGETRLAENLGFTPNPQDFIKFLDDGEQRWKQVQSSPSAQLTSR